MKEPRAEDFTAKLEAVRVAMVDLFPKNEPRLNQLTQHLSTASMVVEHLFDEKVRADFARAERIRKVENEE
jgi:hypothetical protein